MRISLLLVFFCNFAFANSVNYKFGKVSNQEVTHEVHELEPDAKSAILYQEGKTRIEYNETQSRFEVITEVYKRIKVYDASDADIGTITIPYYNMTWNDEKINGLKGTVYNNHNGKMVETDLKKNHIFDEKYTKYQRLKKIAMPNVKKGSVIEIKYKKISPYSSQIPKWYFQFDIPCNKTLYEVETPEWFTYNTSSKGTLAINQKKSEKSRTITLRNSYDASTNPLVVKRKVTYDKVNYRANITTYTAENVPSVKDENFVPCMNNYRSSIAYELLRTRMPGGTTKSYTSSWSGISNMLHENSDLGKQVNKKIKELNPIISKTKNLNADKKAEYLYNYVKDNYAWNGYYGKYVDEGLKELVKSKSGNVGDMNLLLANLFKKAGLEHKVIATRAREYGFINLYYPTQLDLNYVLVQYQKEDGTTILLDATERDIPFGYLPERALNMKGITVQASGGKEINIQNPNITNERQVVKAVFNADMELGLSCTSKTKGYQAHSVEKSFDKIGDSDAIMDKMESIHDGRSYETFEFARNASKPNELEVKERFIEENNVEVIGDKIYITSLMGLFGNDHPYTEESRTLSIFKDDMVNTKMSIQLTIPEGYSLESVPENISFSLPDDMGRFTYSISSQGDKVVISVNEKQNKDILNAQYYDAIRRYNDMIVSKCQEKIVLTKV